MICKDPKCSCHKLKVVDRREFVNEAGARAHRQYVALLKERGVGLHYDDIDLKSIMDAFFSEQS